jgi:hypothetical protein
MITGIIETDRQLSTEARQQITANFEAMASSQRPQFMLLPPGIRYIPLGKFFVFYRLDIDNFGLEQFDSLDLAVAFRDEKLEAWKWNSPTVKILRGIEVT